MTAENDLARILLERARKLAARTIGAADRTVHADAAIVDVGTERFAIPSRFIRGIVPLSRVMRLPGFPPHLAGVVHVRGELLSVVDLGVYLATRGASRPRFLVVVRTDAGPLGLAVEEVVEFRTIHVDEIEPTDSSSRRPTTAVTRDLVQLLDIPRLANDESLVVQ